MSDRNVRNITNKLKDQRFDDVFAAFYRIESMLNKNDQDVKNYVVIRLVTVIEQFFRQIVEMQIKNGKYKGSKLPSQITINTTDLEKTKQMSMGQIISLSFSFQSIKNINETMPNYGITVFNQKSKEFKQKFDELFNLRHDTVHTVISVNTDVKNFHRNTEQLIRHVLEQIYEDDGCHFFSYKGKALMELEKYAKALECFDEAIELDPKFVSAHDDKGTVLMELEEYAKALECFDEAIQVNPKFEWAYYDKGKALMELEKYAKALECFDEAIELDPKFVLAHDDKGTVLMELEEYAKALECFDKAIELDPKYVLTYINKGVVFMILGKYAKALECFDEAVEIDPKFELSYVYKGNALMELDESTKALKCFEKAIEIDPKFVLAYDGKGKILMKLGEPAKAQECFDKAKELEKESK